MIKQVKKILPYQWKLQIKLLQRYFRERKESYQFAKTYDDKKIGKFKLELIQEIKKGSFYENKIHNLNLVADKINNLVLKPNEVFSFWKIVGKPTEKNHFKEGRNLINNKISSDLGGGICQLSSIMYHLSLQAGLEIIERYSHSMDIYKEHERFTPLGADCTIVYGYKDLQIKNNFNFPIQFQCSIVDDRLVLSINSWEKIAVSDIKFVYLPREKGVLVETLRDEISLFKNFYIRS